MQRTALVGAALVMGAALVGTGPAAHAAAAAGGTLYAWGDNSLGQVGIDWVTDNNHPIDQPVAVTGLPADVVQATTARGFVAAVRADGSVWAWGTSDTLQGDNGPTLRTTPHQVAGLPAVAKVSLAGNEALAVGRDGSLWAWGVNDAGEFGGSLADGTYPMPVKVVGAGVVDAAGTGGVVAYLTAGGAVYTAGDNTFGGLGNGTVNPRAGFNAAWTPAGVTQLVATGGGFGALRSDGSVWVWGYQNGDVEQNTGRLPQQVAKPVRLDKVTGVRQLAAGRSHMLAVTATGGVWAWGSDVTGQIGNGRYDLDGTPSVTPYNVGITGVAQVSAGDLTSGAILGDGTLMLWGENYLDRLGVGPVEQHNFTAYPRLKKNLFGVTSVAVGDTAFAVAGQVTATPTTTVPDLSTVGNWAQTLHSAGLVLGDQLTTPDTPACSRVGELAGQDPAADAVVPFGTRVTVTIWVKPPKQSCR